MPLNNIKKILIIGSGPIVIGQAAEFDYSGTLGCKALKEENLDVVLVNSNPATIMTDNAMANHVYIEPLTLESIKKIIEIEKPDSLIPTIGGQTGLNLAMELSKSGFLEKNNVKLLGTNQETIEKAEDRELFKKTMEKINEPSLPSKTVSNLEEAKDCIESLGLPLIVRPAFTLGGSGGGIAKTEEEFLKIVSGGLRISPIKQVLVEKCIEGFKEIEFEIVRDSKGNSISVCSMENIDPVGIHTGDSIVVAPALTLTKEEHNILKAASFKIVNELKVEGSCNCQFAVNPEKFEYFVIEVNPRLSRSSALASKATGYPIAKVATKIAIGYSLDEIVNQVTKTTKACFEPAIDYVVVKFPKWPFDKFIYSKRDLGPQMKATGEVMSIATNFEQALMKSVRGAEIGQATLTLKEYENLPKEKIIEILHKPTDKRIFAIYEALKQGILVDQINKITKIDKWFLNKIKNLAQIEISLKEKTSSEYVDEELYKEAKRLGFLNSSIRELSGKKIKNEISANFKMVDTCAAEFEALTPYFYSSYDETNEAKEFIELKNSKKPKVLVAGAGPIRIGQGIEFDYCCVHCVWTLKNSGFEAIICNNNPETVSTDFDTGDRLYFEPVQFEDIEQILATENPIGVIVQFGGQTAIKLTKKLSEKGIKILGTSEEAIDIAEDREKFDEFLENLNISRPKGGTAFKPEKALEIAKKLGYPVLLRPSYVLGGQNMVIAHNDNDVLEYMKIITQQKIDNPVLIDKYIMGIEVEVDVICDGEVCLIPGIMEHVERAGIHSGDSISVYPSQNLSEKIKTKIVEYSTKIAIGLKIKGLLNIQFVISDNEPLIIEANPRASRTVPFISKVTGVPIVELATKIILGEQLKNLGYGTGLITPSEYVAVKVPIFSFEKLHDVDVHLGPEMKSTGEVLGIAKNFNDALFKGLLAAGYEMKTKNKKGVLITVKDSDKIEIVNLAKKFKSMGFTIFATKGTANFLKSHKVQCNVVEKVHNGENNTLNLIESKKVSYVISTSEKGSLPALDSVKIRRKTVELLIPCLTSIDTANALANSLAMDKTINDVDLIDIKNLDRFKTKITIDEN